MHDIPHLPNMLEACIPLLNVSQFISERVIGKHLKYAKSSGYLETNLLNEYMYLFGLRVFNGGFQERFIARLSHNEESMFVFENIQDPHTHYKSHKSHPEPSTHLLCKNLGSLDDDVDTTAIQSCADDNKTCFEHDKR